MTETTIGGITIVSHSLMRPDVVRVVGERVGGERNTVDIVNIGESPAPEPRDWLVWSKNHSAWHRPQFCGYCRDLVGAGLFTEAEAKRYDNPDDGNQARHISEVRDQAEAVIALYQAGIDRLRSALEVIGVAR